MEYLHFYLFIYVLLLFTTLFVCQQLLCGLLCLDYVAHFCAGCPGVVDNRPGVCVQNILCRRYRLKFACVKLQGIPMSAASRSTVSTWCTGLPFACLPSRMWSFECPHLLAGLAPTTWTAKCTAKYHGGNSGNVLCPLHVVVWDFGLSMMVCRLSISCTSPSPWSILAGVLFVAVLL
jgi:hypothetical protein